MDRTRRYAARGGECLRPAASLSGARPGGRGGDQSASFGQRQRRQHKEAQLPPEAEGVKKEKEEGKTETISEKEEE